MSLDARKADFCIQTTKAQISLRICVGLFPFLCENTIYYMQKKI